MAQESRFGRAVYLNVGASVSTKDGRNIAITSNEVARLGSLLQKSTADDAAGVRCFSKLLHSVTETRAPIGRARLGRVTSNHERSRCQFLRCQAHQLPEMDPASPSTVIRPRDIWRE